MCQVARNMTHNLFFHNSECVDNITLYQPVQNNNIKSDDMLLLSVDSDIAPWWPSKFSIRLFNKMMSVGEKFRGSPKGVFVHE